MDTSALIAIGKICLTLGFMLFAIFRGWQLWLALCGGGVLLGMLFGLGLDGLARVVLETLPSPSFLSLFSVVLCIMLLSEIQGKTGQGQRLVAGLTPYMRSPRMRLVFFPALVGLLPMPGGAIFSCPLVRDVAKGYDLPESKLVLINYWFRHIWESACPLYPGYILTCALAGISPAVLWRYGLPFVIISFSTGWFFLMRAPVRETEGSSHDITEKRPLGLVLLEGLPMALALATAPLYSYVFDCIGKPLPSGTSFVFSFLTASAVAIFQNKLGVRDILGILRSPGMRKMLALILMIYMFKEVVIASNVADKVSHLIAGPSAMMALFLFLPMLMGALTGMMLGFVGSSLPLLVALLSQSGLYDERLGWILFALAAGHFGQMVSPMHSCYLVTVEFFRTPLATTWRTLIKASTTQLLLCSAYVGALYYWVHPIL